MAGFWSQYTPAVRTLPPFAPAEVREALKVGRGHFTVYEVREADGRYGPQWFLDSVVVIDNEATDYTLTFPRADGSRDRTIREMKRWLQEGGLPVVCKLTPIRTNDGQTYYDITGGDDAESANADQSQRETEVPF